MFFLKEADNNIADANTPERSRIVDDKQKAVASEGRAWLILREVIFQTFCLKWILKTQ